MKKLTIILSVILMLSLLALPAQAATEGTYIAKLECTVELDQPLALLCCTAQLKVYDAYESKLVLTIQKYYNGEWIDVYSWEDTGYITVEISETYFYDSGPMYRVEAVGTVYSASGAVLETQTKTALLPRVTSN